jgi:hypothetical protein
MLHHGDIQDRIQNEVDLVIGPDRAPSINDRAAMPYTEAAILETLRFGSIAPIGIPHSVTEDVTYRGHSFPKDSVVSYTHMLVYLTISYYTLGNFSVSICLSVCLCVLSVCVSVHSSQRIFSKYGGNLLRVMRRSVGYICCVCTQLACVRVRAKHALNGLSHNLLGTYNYSP